MCENEFIADRATRKFCSQECYQQYVRESATIENKHKPVEDREVLIIDGNRKKITVVFLADVHNNFEYLRWAVKQIRTHPDWKVVINGDLWDADQFSSHPTLSVTPLSTAVKQTIEILKPVFPQLVAFTWGNHEERCFRRSAGKGTMLNYFDVFFEAWKAVNKNAVVCKPMKSLLLEVKTKNSVWRCLVKHGKSAGKNFGVIEFREVLATNEDIDVFVLSHVHIPEWRIVKRATLDDPRETHLVRTTAGVAFLPYQDRANLFISPLGLTKITFNKQVNVELR